MFASLLLILFLSVLHNLKWCCSACMTIGSSWCPATPPSLILSSFMACRSTMRKQRLFCTQTSRPSQSHTSSGPLLQEIAAPSIQCQQMAELEKGSEVQGQVTAVQTQTTNIHSNTIQTITMTNYEQQVFSSKSNWCVCAISGTHLPLCHVEFFRLIIRTQCGDNPKGQLAGRQGHHRYGQACMYFVIDIVIYETLIQIDI